MSLYKPIAVEKIGYNLTGKKGAWQWFDVGGESGYGNWTCNFGGNTLRGRVKRWGPDRGKERRALWGDGMGTNPDTPLDGTCSYSCLLQESRELRAES